MIFQEIGQFIYVDQPTMMWCCKHERYNEWALDKVEVYQIEVDEDDPLDIAEHIPLLLQQVNGYSIYRTDHVREYALADEITAISVQ
uniref:Uncharacterized protein n=1 Tax=Acrobeloides nanus TaxID=290746 RepID=A0A914D7H8_9BILA